MMMSLRLHCFALEGRGIFPFNEVYIYPREISVKGFTGPYP